MTVGRINKERAELKHEFMLTVTLFMLFNLKQESSKLMTQFKIFLFVFYTGSKKLLLRMSRHYNKEHSLGLLYGILPVFHGCNALNNNELIGRMKTCDS